MKSILLTQGFVAVVDDADYDRVSAYRWSASRTKNTVYGIRKLKTPEGKRTSLLLHRFILGVTDPEIEVHHADHNGLNNQRANLRKTIRGEHDGSRSKSRGSSQYKGVSWAKAKGKWRACITIRKRSIHLGYFDDEIEAARVYDVAAQRCFGVMAKFNFPLQEIAPLP